MTNITITECPDGYATLYNEDGLPVQDSEGPFVTVQAAKEAAEVHFDDLVWDNYREGDVVARASHN